MAVLKRVLLSAVFLASCAAAAPLCTTLTTLDQYEALGSGGCVLGDKLFYSFNYGGGTTGVAASAVNVTTSVTGGGLIVGLTFTGNWMADTNNTVNHTTQVGDVTLIFSVMAPPSAPMIKTSLSMSGNIYYVKPTGLLESVGNIQAGENVSNGATGSVPVAPITTSSLAPDSSLQTSSGSLSFAPTTGLRVTKDLNLSSGGSINTVTAANANYQREHVTLVSFTETFYEQQNVPEPAVFLTFGSGLLLLGLAGKRFLPAGRARAITSARDNNKNNHSEAL